MLGSIIASIRVRSSCIRINNEYHKRQNETKKSAMRIKKEKVEGEHDRIRIM